MRTTRRTTTTTTTTVAETSLARDQPRNDDDEPKGLMKERSINFGEGHSRSARHIMSHANIRKVNFDRSAITKQVWLFTTITPEHQVIDHVSFTLDSPSNVITTRPQLARVLPQPLDSCSASPCSLDPAGSQRIDPANFLLTAGRSPRAARNTLPGTQGVTLPIQLLLSNDYRSALPTPHM
jgi:hypothetical protein